MMGEKACRSWAPTTGPGAGQLAAEADANPLHMFLLLQTTQISGWVTFKRAGATGGLLGLQGRGCRA